MVYTFAKKIRKYGYSADGDDCVGLSQSQPLFAFIEVTEQDNVITSRIFRVCFFAKFVNKTPGEITAEYVKLNNSGSIL
ncbi:MAG: hypothetical protein K0Q73_7314 [Paenibacillus sp.]|jgi:hypothetical protein|nr:hypothetical protein [Paenibacillus sp.]